jgi:hypothetical protein
MTRHNCNTIWVLVLLLAGCTESTEGDRNRIVAQQLEETPVVKHVKGGDMSAVPGEDAVLAPTPFTKVLVVEMSVDKTDAVTLRNPRVQYGEPPNQIGNPPMFTAQLLDRIGATIISVPLWDPRWTFVWTDEKHRDFLDLAEKGDTVVVIPFNGTMATMILVKDKDRVAAVDLSSAIMEFCAKNREDPECRRRPTPNPPTVQRP